MLAAADPTGDVALLRRASELLSLGQNAYDAACGELSIGRRVEFRDSLLRFATYRAATVDQRRRVHAALAQATSAADDGDRSAWHRARATLELDERVAAELERSAARARERGGVAAAAAFLERAAALSPKPARRGRRLLAATHAKYEAAAPEAALALLDSLDAEALTPCDRAHAARLRARAAYGACDAVSQLVAAAYGLEPCDMQLARLTYLEAHEVARPGDRAWTGRALLEALGDDDAPLMRGVALLAIGDAEAALPLLRRALAEPQEAWALRTACRAAAHIRDAGTYRALCDRLLERARAGGALVELPAALAHAVSARVLDGRLDEAEALADEVDAVLDATGQAFPRTARRQVQAWREDEAPEQTLEGDCALGLLDFARAEPADDAEARCRQAIASFRHAGMPLLEGRARLYLGERLRRRDRRLDAREQLHAAHALLSAGGARGLAERARRELAATGETVQRRAGGAVEPLTPQERSVARMACDGLTNREIAGHLFISARTVEYHLRKVFVKLGISSCRQLAGALAPRAAGGRGRAEQRVGFVARQVSSARD